MKYSQRKEKAGSWITEIFTLDPDKFDPIMYNGSSKDMIHFQVNILLKRMGRENNHHHNIEAWKSILQRNSGIILPGPTGLSNHLLNHHWIVPLFFQKCFHPTSKSTNCRVTNQMSNLLQIATQIPPIPTKLKLHHDPACSSNLMMKPTPHATSFLKVLFSVAAVKSTCLLWGIYFRHSFSFYWPLANY